MPPSSMSIINSCLRIWSTKDYAISVFVFLLLVSLILLSRLDSHSTDYHSQSHLVPLTLLSNSNALCLDGSAPGYHFQKGFGSGSLNWLLHIEGGGWCDSISSCSQRKFTHLGSSKYMEAEVPFTGILSPYPSENPDFFNWNKVKICYCDGASFAGNPDSERKKKWLVLQRGQIIWEATMDEFLSIGMSKAKQITSFPKQGCRESLLIGGFHPSDRLLHYLLTYMLLFRGTNHATCIDLDLQVMYGTKN